MTFFDIIHFERPYWLLLIPALCLVVIIIRYQQSTTNALNKVIDQNLLLHLEHKGTPGSLNKWLGVVCLCLCLIGLAGISWTKSASTMFESTSKTIFIVDQSMSMYATDIKPDRQTQLKQSVRDILSQSKDGDIALISFAGDAYTISPFSQDKKTITHFLLALNPLVMPVYGSNLTSGIETALSLITDKKQRVKLIVFTDSLNEKDQNAIPDLLHDYNIQLELIAIGTKLGGEIQLPDGRVLKSNGKNVIPPTPIEQLKALSDKVGGQFFQGRLSQTDLTQITGQSMLQDKAEQADNKSIHWVDQGQWFALPFMLWLVFQFRQGMLFILLIGFFTLPANKVNASPLSWFMTPDQQGQQAANKGDWNTASKHFQRPDWQAASDYALGDYKQAATILSNTSHSASDQYNLGNAFALSGKTSKAMAAYQKALELDPTFKQAQENLSYLEKQQKKSTPQQKKQDDKNKQDNKNQNKESPSKDENSQPNQKNQSPKPKKDNKSTEKQDNKQASEDNKDKAKHAKEQQKKQAKATLDNEQKQALNQWLRQIQDNPGTLLQRKLWYLHQEKRHENQFSQEDEQKPW